MAACNVLSMMGVSCATDLGGGGGWFSRDKGEGKEKSGWFGKKDKETDQEKETGSDEGDGEKSGLFGNFRKKKSDPEAEEEHPRRPIVEPQQLPIGTVHLVHDSGGFVLIQSSRLASIPPQAELFTYSLSGKPTGKLRISPKRKAAFLTADILEGMPSVGDRVLMFSYLDSEGEVRFDAIDPDAVEVLE